MIQATIDLSAHVTTEPYDLVELRRSFEADPAEFSRHAVAWLLDHVELQNREQSALASYYQDLADENAAQQSVIEALRARIKRLEARVSATVPEQSG